jgi:hypothetical protein
MRDGGVGEMGLQATPTPTSHHHSRIHLPVTAEPHVLQHPVKKKKNIVVSCDVLLCALHIHIQILKPHFLFYLLAHNPPFLQPIYIHLLHSIILSRFK